MKASKRPHLCALALQHGQSRLRHVLPRPQTRQLSPAMPAKPAPFAGAPWRPRPAVLRHRGRLRTSTGHVDPSMPADLIARSGPRKTRPMPSFARPHPVLDPLKCSSIAVHKCPQTHSRLPSPVHELWAVPLHQEACAQLRRGREAPPFEVQQCTQRTRSTVTTLPRHVQWPLHPGCWNPALPQVQCLHWPATCK